MNIQLDVDIKIAFKREEEGGDLCEKKECEKWMSVLKDVLINIVIK